MFLLLQFLLQQSNPLNQTMKNKRVQLQKWAYKFTKPTIMKFQPIQDFQEPANGQQNTFVSRIKMFFSPPKVIKPKGHIKRMNSLVSNDIRQQLLKKHIAKKPLLKYVKRLTNEHVLIGNQDQIDAMSISGIIHEFVDTQFMWSINIKKAILHMAIDYKKNYIILLPQKEVIVMKYDSKLIRQKPSQLTSFKLSNEVHFVQVIKESIFILCYSTGIEVLTIDENKGIRVTAQKKYDIPAENQLKLLQIPPPYENILNIFFEEILQSSTSLALWNIQVQFFEKEVKMSKAHKVYDIPKFLKKFVRLENYSKDIYLINLGRLIYAVRKGYIIDFANVNISSQDNYLKYISHQKLMHISSSKVQIYQFKVDMNVNPPRIILDSTDSIQLPSFPAGFQYVDAVQILTDNFAIFYQTKQEYNKMMHGQLKYGFVLSHSVKLQDKIKQLLPNQIKNVNIATINQKADMVNKMGLQRKDIYLRLWNNSEKTTIEDYKILLDTLDYDTIKLQVEKKLKKASMNLRQMILLQQGCLAMLSKNVFGPSATKEDIKNYFTSHLLIRKFELYRLFSIIDKKEGKAIIEDEEGKLLINIQNYNYYKTVDIKFYLYELISIYCNQQKDVIIKIRILLKHFKFSLRINYQEILQNIIIKTKKKFLKILQAIPQLLPFQHTHHANKEEDESYYEGIWEQISSQQWQKHLYLDNVVTIDNKEALSETCSNVWFKRYWLSHHQFINKNKKEILQIYKLNCSDVTFYNVIEKTFDNLKDYASIKAILDHIQDHYEKLPTHLFGKIFLYRKLYQQFKENRRINKVEGTIDNFKDFLRLKDQDIFKMMFNFQKVKKNFILKEMKPLYIKLSGSQIFNEGLLNYFASDLSEISDIKYLLNRMNNEKIEFHEQNEGIYEVLVRGMQLKLKLGSPQDIPIDQVLIYIENIPLSPYNPIMKDLQTMRLINQQAKRFKKIKLNMSIFQMMKNVDDVVASLVNYQIQQSNVLQMREYPQIKDITHRIIFDVQQLKKKIFSETEYSQLTLFAYLTKLLEEQQLIGLVAVLLEDDWINRNFNLNQTMIENIVLYMYKWRMNHKPSYVQSSPYLQELINLLPTNNKCRQYIEAEIEFSQILSTPEQNIYYPLSNGKEYFTIIQLQNIINNTPAHHLLTVNIQHLHQCSLKIQQISTDDRCSQIKLHDLYEMIILRLIECGLLREVISKIKTLISIQSESPFNFIYPSLLVAKIAPQLIDQNRNLLLKCTGYLFNKPKELTEILDNLMSTKATSNGYKTILQRYYDKYRTNLTYSQSSPVLESLYIQLLQNDQLKTNFDTILKHSLGDILQYKEEFYRNPQYYLSYIILCNDPYVLIKYFYCIKYTINIKHFRCFLSLISRQEAFNTLNLLQFSKRMFFTVFQSITKNKNLQSSIEQIKEMLLTTSKEIHRIKQTKSQFQKKLSKSLDRLKFKIKSVNAKMERKKARGKLELQQKKIERFRERLLNPENKQKTLQYPFLDSDDIPKNSDDVLKKQQKIQINIIEGFDAKYERESLMKRTIKDIGQFISIERQKQQRSLYYTQKYSKDGIFGSLQNDKRIGYILETAMNKAFRQSVKRSPRKLRIGKITNDFLEPQPLDLIQITSSRRSRSPTVISQDQLQQIHKIQEKIVEEDVVPSVGNILLQAFIIDQLVKGNDKITEKTEFNLLPLQKYKRHPQFGIFLKQIARLSFGKEIPFQSVLIFIKKLNEKYSQCCVNNLWMQIYMRAQSLQNKFNLDLPLRSILKADGLFIDSQMPERLFNYLLPFIVQYSDDQNVMKICKVITLAFKKPQLQNEILLSYLIKLFIQYQILLYRPGIKQQQLRMHRQKALLILNKIPIKMLLSREDQLVKQVCQQTTKKELIGLVITSFRRRYDNKAAEYMEQKWINNKKDFKLAQ